MNKVTQLLKAVGSGDQQATDELLLIVYDDLRWLASQNLSRETPGQTLQPTALVHEAYIRLVGSAGEQDWDHQGHFFMAAAEAMRRILVENARRKKTLKQGGNHNRAQIELGTIEVPERDDELLALEEALQKLAESHARKAKLVELRYFGGLTMEQAAKALGISEATAGRDWVFARAWLHRALSDEGRNLKSGEP